MRTVHFGYEKNTSIDIGLEESYWAYTVCPGSSDPPEKTFNIFASENEVYTIY